MFSLVFGTPSNNSVLTVRHGPHDRRYPSRMMTLPIFLMLAVGCVSALAQTGTLPNEAASKPTPEPSEEETDRLVKRWEAREKAVRRALRLSEPDKRILALKNLLREFPEDAEVPAIVDDGILDTYIKYRPKQTANILAQIDKVLTQVPADFKTGSGTNVYNKIAVKLVERGILLDKARELAARGLEVFDEKKFIQAQKTKAEMHAKWIALNKNVAAVLNTEPVTEAGMSKLMAAERAKALAILGRVYLAEDKAAEAEKILKEAYSANPNINEVNIALADIASRAGQNESVVEYLSAVAVRIPLKSELRQQLEAAYRKRHNGSVAGIEEMLDEKYRLLMPNPLTLEPYKPSASRTKRVVLAEVFTGSGCGPCVGADLAVEAAIERYSRKNLVLLMYHLHRPLPDPMVNRAAISRADFYGVKITPTVVIDGEKDTGGGALREKTRIVYDRIAPIIEKELETAEGADIEVHATLQGNFVNVKGTVNQRQRISGGVKLQLVLVEDELRYAGENLVRIHPMVVRSIAGPKGGYVVNQSGPTVVEYTFDLGRIAAEMKAYLEDYEVNGDYGPFTFKEKKHNIDRNNLSVIALVQDELTKKVLQSTYSKVEPAMFAR